MSDQKIKLGKIGEEIGAKYLKAKGYKILARNFYTRQGEIDLICQKDRVIHFIEVKTRTSQSFGWPEEAVDEKKIEKISESAQKYLQQNNIRPEWQIDIIGIIIEKENNSARIDFFENIC